jgi:hypothetical protein
MSELLPPEVLRLAIAGAEPAWAAPVEWDAKRLTEIARASALDDWTPLKKVYSLRGRERLEGAQIYHDRQYGAPPMAVGRTPMVTGRVARRTGWYVAINGLPLRNRGQILLFTTVRRAQRAAVLGAEALAWHRVFSLALPAALQAGELLKLSDEHDPVLTAKGVAHLTPRYLATRHALGTDDGLIMRGKIEGTVTSSPMKALARATQELFGSILAVESEYYDTKPPSLTFNSADYPGIDLAAAKAAIDKVLARLDELHDGDYEREIQRERQELFDSVERQVALREPGNRHA